MNVAVFGATGQVGFVMRKVLEERNFPVSNMRFFASSRSAGSSLLYDGVETVVEDAAEADFQGIDIALLSIGAVASKEIAPQIAKAGATVIDNSSAWRMDPEVPLVVPEVNSYTLDTIPKNIVANPNCTTIIAVLPIKAVHEVAPVRRVVASTYQAVSGAGRLGVKELSDQLQESLSLSPSRVSELTFDGSAFTMSAPVKFTRQIAHNLIPLVGNLVGDDTDEELKLINETRKILDLPALRVSCTCVRVPVFCGHCVSLNLELDKELSVGEAIEVFRNTPGIQYSELPTPLEVAGSDRCLVGRVRKDTSVQYGLSLFVCGDNLRKGAATNAVEIAQVLLDRLR